MAGVSSKFSLATATTIQLFGCLFGKKWCLEKGIAKEIENYEPTQLNTLFERFYAEIKTNMVKPRNDDSISSKVIRTQTEQFLELFSRTLNFFAP